MDAQLFLSIIVWLTIGTATAYFANQRGRDPWIWFMVGMLLGLIGLLILFLLPSSNEENSESTEKTDEKGLLLSEQPSPIEQKENKSWYYYDQAQEQRGPISLENLKILLAAKEIRDDTYLWCEGMTEWKQLISLPELYNKLQC